MAELFRLTNDYNFRRSNLNINTVYTTRRNKHVIWSLLSFKCHSCRNFTSNVEWNGSKSITMIHVTIMSSIWIPSFIHFRVGSHAFPAQARKKSPKQGAEAGWIGRRREVHLSLRYNDRLLPQKKWSPLGGLRNYTKMMIRGNIRLRGFATRIPADCDCWGSPEASRS